MLIDLKQSGAERGEWQNLWVSPTTYSLHYNLGAAPRYSAALLPATSSIPLTSCSWLPYLSHLPGFLILVWESPSVSLSYFVAPANKPHFYFQAGSLFLHFSWSNPCWLCFRQKIPASLLYVETMSALANTVAQREQIYGVNQWNSSGPCVHPISISENFFFEQAFMGRTLIYIRTGPQFLLWFHFAQPTHFETSPQNEAKHVKWWAGRRFASGVHSLSDRWTYGETVEEGVSESRQETVTTCWSLTVWQTKYRKTHIQLLWPGLETFSAMMLLENLGTIH